MIKKISIFILIGGVIFSCIKKEENVSPTLDNRIRDEAGILSASQKDSLFASIENLEVSFGPEIGIVIVDSLKGESIEEFSLRIASEFIVGRRDFKDGILICVAMKNKKIRIDAGKGLSKIITDDTLKLINRQDVAPMFKKGEYFKGLYIGVNHLKALIQKNKERIGQWD